jgi:hypothetical protein
MAKQKAVSRRKRSTAMSKAQGKFIHKLHTGKLSKRESKAAATWSTATAASGETRGADGGRRYHWTNEQDRLLREHVSANPRRAARAVATVLGWPFHVVKSRIHTLGLTTTPPAASESETSTPVEAVTESPTPTRARSRKTRAKANPPEVTPPAAAAPAETSAGAPAARLRHAVCPNRPKCYTRAKWDPNDTPEQQREQGFIYGMDPSSGLPICPNCRTTMVADEPVEAEEAIDHVNAAQASHQPRLWPDPPFNHEGALQALFEKGREIRHLKGAAEAAQKTARKAQKEYAQALLEKDRMEEQLEERMRLKQREAQRLQDRAEERAELATSDCVFEAGTTKPCAICRADSPSLVVAAIRGTAAELTDRASERHRTAAQKAHTRALEAEKLLQDAALVAAALQLRGLLGIGTSVVETWDEIQRREALAWADSGCDREHPTAVIGLPHVAADRIISETHDQGKTADTYQCCVECGARLVTLAEDAVSYPAHALVGMHCTGAETDAAHDAPAAAAAHA